MRFLIAPAIALLLAAGAVSAQAPRPADPIDTIHITVVPGQSISIDAAADRVSVRPSMIKGQSRIEIDTSPRKP